MRILVADDDKVARKVLDMFLRQSKHEVEVVENGADALRVMLAGDAPHVAIFDWVMPDIGGPELCRKIRQHDFAIEPYLIILSSKKEKSEIAQALDAGADDFLTKPFNIVETQARLRVAERAIAHQLGLHRQIAELGAALQRHMELFEPEALTSGDAAPVDHLAGIAPLAPEQIESAFAEVLQAEIAPSVHVSPPAPAADPAGAPGTILAWAGILLAAAGVWIDLLLETDAAGATVLFQQARGLPPGGPQEMTEFCSSVHASLCEVVIAQLRGSRMEFYVPFDPVAPGSAATPFLRSLTQRTGRSHHFKVEGIRIAVTLLASPSPLQAKRSEQLRLLDVIGQPYPPPESNEILILPEGIPLNERMIERLGRFADGRVDAPPIHVHRPSSLAMHYNRNRGRIGAR